MLGIYYIYFLLINACFVSLYTCIQKFEPGAKLILSSYWFSAFYPEFVPFIKVLILLFKVHGKQRLGKEININIKSPKPRDIVPFSCRHHTDFQRVINQINKLYVYILNIYFSIEAKPQKL